MQEIYLLRHGETVWNSEGRYQGNLDSPLTTKGRNQVKANGQRLKEILPANVCPRILASPLGRAKETADIIRQSLQSPPVQFDSRLREVSIGSWDGMSFDEIDKKLLGPLNKSRTSDWFFRSPDGERFADAVMRIESLLNEIDGLVVAVSHGVIGRIIRGVHCGLSANGMLLSPSSQDVIWHLQEAKEMEIVSERTKSFL
jgi:broad specificity phosphatase PhoE